MYFFLFLIFGLFVGAISNYLYPHKQKGAMVSLISGVAGSYIGGLFNYLVLGYETFAPGWFLSSIAGGVIFNIVYVYIRRKIALNAEKKGS